MKVKETKDIEQYERKILKKLNVLKDIYRF